MRGDGGLLCAPGSFVRWVALVLLALVLGAFGRAYAHDLPYTLVEVDVEQGALEFTVSTHVPAFMLGEPSAPLPQAGRDFFLGLSDERLEDLVDRARTRFRDEFFLRINGAEAGIGLPDFPSKETLRTDAELESGNLRPSAPIRFRLQTDNAELIELALPELLGSAVVVLNRPDGEVASAMMSSAELSGPLSVSGRRDWSDTVKSFVWAGALHIVPYGLDHVLFVACLALAGISFRSLLLLISAFTVAHSITLALAALGIVSIPSAPVELVIALSIVFVAVLNLFSTVESGPRLASVFILGLVHGLGFAGVLGDFALPENALILALVSFNIGVEIGQVLVVLAIIALVGWWKNRSWYLNMVARPASLGIALVASVWTIERAGALL